MHNLGRSISLRDTADDSATSTCVFLFYNMTNGPKQQNIPYMCAFLDIQEALLDFLEMNFSVKCHVLENI